MAEPLDDAWQLTDDDVNAALDRQVYPPAGTARSTSVDFDAPPAGVLPQWAPEHSVPPPPNPANAFAAPAPATPPLSTPSESQGRWALNDEKARGQPTPNPGPPQGQPVSGMAAGPVPYGDPTAPVLPHHKQHPPGLSRGHGPTDDSSATPTNYRVVEDASAVVRDPDSGVSGRVRRFTDKVSGKSGRDVPPEELLARIRKNLNRPMNVVFCNHAGGSGKTLTTAAVGQMLSTHRRDRVIAVDAASVIGGLSHRLPIDNQSNIRTFLDNIHTITRWTDIREHTSQGRTGLELLTSTPGVADDDVLTAADYVAVLNTLRDHDNYNLILTDCDAGATGSLMDAVFLQADLLVLPMSGADGVVGAVAVANRINHLGTVKYPEHADHFQSLLSNSIAVINHAQRDSLLRDDEVRRVFEETIRVRDIISVPFDPKLRDGAPIDVAEINKKTERAFIKVAASIVHTLSRMP